MQAFDLKCRSENFTMDSKPTKVLDAHFFLSGGEFYFSKEKAKYHFVKKSAILSGDKNFKFNFPKSDSNGETETVPGAAPVAVEKEGPAKGEKKVATVVAPASVIVPSDNSFRFNFAVGGE